MTTRIKFRRDTAQNWTTSNPVLALGEPGLETDTRKVKYGDGVTAWNVLNYGVSSASTDFNTGFNDGVNDNTWHFAQIQGKKEFTFETEGYKNFEITLTAAMVVDINVNGNLIFNQVDTPQMADVWLTYTRENQVEFFMKADWDVGNYSSWFQNMSNPAPGVFTTPAPVPFVAGDQIVCRYWSEGSTYVGDNYDTYSTFVPDVSEQTADNTVTISLAEFPWLGIGPNTARSDLLDPQYFSKHSISFIQNDVNDTRNITNAVDNNNNTVTITFDGTPYQSKTTETVSFTYTATDTRVDDWSLTVPVAAYPTFAFDAEYPIGSDTNKYTGGAYRSGYVTINGGGPIDFYWYGNSNGATENYLNWVPSPQSYNQGDTIVVTFYKVPTKIQLEIFRPTNAQFNWNNGHKWFDWKDDIATEYSAGAGNGIMGGTGQILMKTYRAPIGNWSASTGSLVSSFGWTDLGNYQRSPYDPYTQNNVSDWGLQSNSGYPMYRFDRNGIVFFSNETYNSQSVTYKVRIIYKFDLIIGEDDSSGWFNC